VACFASLSLRGFADVSVARHAFMARRGSGPHLAGVDGCRAGWLCVIASGDGRPLTAVVTVSLGVLLHDLSRGSLIAVDVPIGLADRGARPCDVDARRCLGSGRGSSVFPAPLRCVLSASSYEEACRRCAAVDGKRMSRQAFGLVVKVREVDALMSEAPALQSRVRECHPEVSFRAWAARPLRHGKKTRSGQAERAALIDAEWPGERGRLATLLGRGGFRLDDLHDAFAALWTARRIRDGVARTLPSCPQRDGRGLAMEIVV
jgi:predicted RNase H-like nuclease